MSRTPPDESSLRRLLGRQSLVKLVLVATVAAGAGTCAAWVTASISAEVLNLHVAIWTFLTVWAGLVGYFFYLRVPSSVIGSGFYVIGLSIILKPPVVFTSRTDDATAEGTLRMAEIQSISELFISVLVFGVIGLVVIGVGAYFRRRGERERYRRMRAMLRTWD
jgi:hypothetical protein